MMRHFIVVKFKDGVDWRAFLPDVEAIFAETLKIAGVESARVLPSNSTKANRYDLMIEMTMEASALAEYDGCGAHLRWKSEYGGFISAKTIFDCDL